MAVKTKKKLKKDARYQFTVVGQYYAHNGDKKTTRKYEVDVVLPTGEAALSVIKNFVLDKALSNKYQDYAGFRTHQITKTLNLDDPMEEVDSIDYMSRKGLLDVIEDEELPVKEYLYPELNELRNAIKDCFHNEESFVAYQNKYEEKHTPTIELKSKLAALNPDILGDSED